MTDYHENTKLLVFGGDNRDRQMALLRGSLLQTGLPAHAGSQDGRPASTTKAVWPRC